MKTSFKIYLVGVILMYIVMAFTFWQVNPGLWDIHARGICLFLPSAAAMLYFMIVAADQKNYNH